MTINVFHLVWIVPTSMLMGIGGFLWAAAWAIGRAEKDLEDEAKMFEERRNSNDY